MRIAAVIMLAALTACQDQDKVETVTVEGVDCTTTVNRPGSPIDVEVSGMSCTVNITDQTELRRLSVTGMNNLVTVLGSVESVEVTGSDNVVQLPADTTALVSVTGLGSRVDYQ